MSYSYTITSKGQLTIPKKLRDKIGLRSGDKANVSLLDDRTIVIKAALDVASIRRNVGPPSGKQPLTPKERQKLAVRGL